MKRREIWILPVLAVCLFLLAGTAGAEEIIDLNCGRRIDLTWRCTLPDGGLVLTGCRDAYEDAKKSDAYILCLNRDRTVRWEYADMNKNGYTTAEEATVLSDGTVAAVVWDYPRKTAVKFFRPENGKQARKKLDMTRRCGRTGHLYDLAPSFMMVLDSTGSLTAGDFQDITILFDLRGKEIARYDGLVMRGGYGFAIKGTDELVAFGQDTIDHSHAKFMKMDPLQGEILWETTLDYQLPDTNAAVLDDIVKTEDGGYVGWLQEGKPTADGFAWEFRYWLARFDAEGRLLWTKDKESLSREGSLSSLFSCGDKIVMVYRDEDEESWSNGAPLRFLWLDLDGNKLGTTELDVKPQDFPLIRDCPYPENDSTYWFPCIGLNQMIPMEDGLWAFACVYIAEKEDGLDGFLYPPEKQEYVMFRIPEKPSKIL